MQGPQNAGASDFDMASVGKSAGTTPQPREPSSPRSIGSTTQKSGEHFSRLSRSLSPRKRSSQNPPPEPKNLSNPPPNTNQMDLSNDQSTGQPQPTAESAQHHESKKSTPTRKKPLSQLEALTKTTPNFSSTSPTTTTNSPEGFEPPSVPKEGEKIRSAHASENRNPPVRNSPSPHMTGEAAFPAPTAVAPALLNQVSIQN